MPSLSQPSDSSHCMPLLWQIDKWFQGLCYFIRFMDQIQETFQVPNKNILVVTDVGNIKHAWRRVKSPRISGT